MLNLHILIVDEAHTIEDIAAALAGDAFFIVRGCQRGREAPAEAIAWRPDMVLLSVAPPDLDGGAVLAQLRRDERTAPIPVVVLAGRGQAREGERLKALGAGGVIGKPIDPSRLGVELRKFVAVEGVLAPARETFLQRLKADARALSTCRRNLAKTQPKRTLLKINRIAHSLAGAGGIYGFAGITCESAALSLAAESNLAGLAKRSEVERALERLLDRIASR